MTGKDKSLKTGSDLMFYSAVAFVLYALVFLYRSFFGSGFELGVDELGGLSKGELLKQNPEIGYYITHLHIAVSGFIAATGIAVAALSKYGVRNGYMWAWVAAVLSPVTGLAVALPMHWLGYFNHDWVTHLGPIYIATLVFVAGSLISIKEILSR